MNALTKMALLLMLGGNLAQAHKLIVTTTEYTIQKGELKKQPIVKSWALPDDGVQASKKHDKISTLLTPALDKAIDQINARKPLPAKFKNVGGSWMADDQIGWLADRDATKAQLLKDIKAGKDTTEVKIKEIVPERNVKLLSDRGVLWHISRGSSSYAGSPDFREKNILVGADKLDNFFIAPEREFDFNEEIGKIDASTGFVKGFVISGGTLAKEDGGGICQVSTTIFRALYEAGLPITERHEHSHRVSYYDPVGYEATVYAPYKNLKVKNDTGQHLFVQANWNTKTKTLSFDIFGANTGRQVSVSKPVITDFKAPKKPSYTPDTRVALGSRRLLDTPMQGMTSVIVRTIKNADGKVISKDTLKSVYQPWGAVYGVHPKDKRLK